MPKSKASRADALASIVQAVERADDWVNMLSGMGVQGQDKRLNYEFTRRELTLEKLETLYRGSDVAATIVDSLPEDMTRQGFHLHIEGDEKGLAEEVIALLDEVDALPSLQEAMSAARLYGGSGILLGVTDGKSQLAAPLDMERIQPGSLRWMTVFTPAELEPLTFVENAMERLYGAPETYRILEEPLNQGSKPKAARKAPIIHASRIIRFNGVAVPRKHLRESKGWGDSVLLRCHRVIQDYQTSWDSAALLLQDFAIAIMKIKGLAEAVATQGDDSIQRRSRLLALSKSIAKVTLMDSEEEYERKSTPLSGLPEMLDKFALRLSSAARMPVSRLMGQAPAGLNATGDSDIRWWYDSVKTQQARVLRPALNHVVKMAFKSLGAEEPANWMVSFPPLWQPTEGEQADIRKKQAETDGIYLDRGALTPEEVAISRWGGGEYSTKTTIDIKAREQMAKAREPQPEAPPEPDEEVPLDEEQETQAP